jgi:hypothetical protein
MGLLKFKRRVDKMSKSPRTSSTRATAIGEASASATDGQQQDQADRPPFPPSPLSSLMGNMGTKPLNRNQLADFFAGTYVPLARKHGFDRSVAFKRKGVTRLVSYNVHMIMGYSRTVPTGGDLIVKAISALDADMLCMQEGHPAGLPFHSVLPYTYGFGREVDWTHEKQSGLLFHGPGPLGNAIMSKHEMFKEKTVRYTSDSHRGEQRARIEVDLPLPNGQGVVHIITTHFDGTFDRERVRDRVID